MGNTQAGDLKSAKSGKSPGKVKALIKIRGKRAGKPDDPPFTGIVPERQDKSTENEDATPKDKCVTPTSAESSSESVFTDPSALTPVGFSTEINECYYSDENVNINNVVIPDSVPSNFMELPLNSFKLNEFKERKNEELGKRLSKLGLSKTSQISLESDLRDCFVSDNIECIVVEQCPDHLNCSSPLNHQRCEGMANYSSGPTEYKRPTSVPAASPDLSEGNLVLKRVISLTLDKDVMENRVTKPKFVPEKLDFKLYENLKVRYMLINWYLSEFSENHQLKHLVQNQNLKLLATQFCTHLLAAGVLHQIPDKDVPMYNIFKPDLMYYWAHSETPASVPQTPGRLNSLSWPPTSPCPSEVFTSSPIASNGAIKESSPVKSSAKDAKILALEDEIKCLKQDLEKYKTLIEIQTLTNNAVKDFGSPSDTRNFFCQHCDICRNKLNDFNDPSESNAQFNAEAQSSIIITEASTDDSFLPNEVPVPQLLAETPVKKTQNGFSMVSPSFYTYKTPPTSFEKHTDKPCKLAAISLQNDLTGLDATSPPNLNVSASDISPPSGVSPAVLGPLLYLASQPPPPSDLVEPLHTETSDIPLPLTLSPIPPPPPCYSKMYDVQSPLLIQDIPVPPALPQFPTVPSPSEESVIPPLPQMQSIPPPPPPLPSETHFIPPAPPPPQTPAIPPPPPLPQIPGIPFHSPQIPGIPPPPPPTEMHGILPPTQTFGVPPPPPPPLANGAPPPPPLLISDAPTPPPPPIGQTPAPLPTPPVGGWNPYKSMLRKEVVTPKAPMKPLYWTRLVVPNVTATPTPTTPSSEAIWSQVEELKLDNLTEFTDLFSRQIITKSVPKKKIQTKTKIEPIKILDSKRSQNVGILAQSLHVEFSEIENAVYTFDTSVVSLEALQQIYEVRAAPEELRQIREHLEMKPDIPLDKPEQFLYELSEISNFAERISCFMVQIEFDDSIVNIDNTLNNIKSTCEFLTSNNSLIRLLSIILTLGNYMNGGNMSRGQADGYGLEILAKLKDVKSKDAQVTLLHFVVATYMREYDYLSIKDAPLPVPQPEEIRRASAVNFDDVHADLQVLQTNLKTCENRIQKVLESSTEEYLQPFKEKMAHFIINAKDQLKTQLENLDQCKKQFVKTMIMYRYKSKAVGLEATPPSDFFDLWYHFCKDLKDIWKKELLRLEKEKKSELKKLQAQRNMESVRRNIQPNSLKEKVKKLLEEEM
ncbi:hypothetical protein RI129_005677 [Pyrocoelia pectoralis]|uniref:FH2 domain-containing protein n=1 Tax=Pyrocoelia pectoralis TaxID=417401 RepID=A0AAN7ZJ58_9COLE